MASAEAVLLILRSHGTGREVHVGFAEACRLPGVASGASGSPLAECEWSEIACFWLNGPAEAVLPDACRLLGIESTANARPPLVVAGERLTERFAERGTPAAPPTGLFLVLTNCMADEDEAFNRWYDERHIPDVLAVPGFVAAQRFRLMDEAGTTPRAHRYGAVYEIAGPNPAASIADLRSRTGTERMWLSPTFDRASALAIAVGLSDVYGGML